MRFLKEDKDEIIGQAIGEAVNKVQDLLTQSGILETTEFLKRQLSDGNAKQQRMNKDYPAGKSGQISNNLQELLNAYNSELTIYHNAVKDGTGKNRISTSSEEDMDVSDETNDILIAGEDGFSTSLGQIDQFIVDCR